MKSQNQEKLLVEIRSFTDEAVLTSEINEVLYNLLRNYYLSPADKKGKSFSQIFTQHYGKYLSDYQNRFLFSPNSKSKTPTISVQSVSDDRMVLVGDLKVVREETRNYQI